jgi:acetoacetyl-CoA synthetase
MSPADNQPEMTAATSSVQQPEAQRGSEPIDALVTEIWDRVLDRGPSAREASILDLKVGLLRVHRLLAEIGKATGVTIPVTAKFKADTLQKLIAIVRSGESPASEVLAELKPGNGGPPLFIFPGISGVALELAQLARLIRYDGPIYGNQPRGLDGEADPHRSITEMAAYQAAAIKDVQPRGPFRLLGYSCGGLVAIEVARLLLRQGEKIEWLGLMEPSLPERQWPLAAHVEFFWRRARHHVNTLRQLNRREMKSYLASHAEPMGGRLRRMLGQKHVGVSPYHRDGLPAGLAETRAAGWAALQAHELAPYPGKATMFVSDHGNPLGVNVLLAYPKYLEAMEVRRLRGTHSGMLREPFVEQTAEHISDCLMRLDLMAYFK